MVADIVDVDGLFNAIFTPVKIHPILVLPTVRGPRLAGSGSKAFKIGLETISWPLKLMVSVLKETDIFQTFHVRQV